MTTAAEGAYAPPLATRPAWIETLSSFWQQVRRFYRLLLPIRFSFLALGVLAFALLASDQGHDALAALAEGNANWTARGNLLVRIFFLILTPLLALQTWYWSRQLLRIQFPEQPDPAGFRWAVSWLPRLLGLLAFAIVIVSLAVVRGTYGDQVTGPRTTLLWMMGVAALEAALFVVFVILRRKSLGEVEVEKGVTSFGTSTKVALLLTFLLAVAFFLASTFFVQRVGRMGTISLLVLSLGLWVSLGGAVVYGGMKARIPILTWLLLFAIAISPWADNHELDVIPDSSPLVAKRLNAPETFNQWYGRLARNYPYEAIRPVFIVATEGGGIRAGYWTAAVLTSLHDTVPGFTDHLFAVSGVSGGSLGAATYRALLAEGAGPIRPKARVTLAHDALAPTISAFTQQDFVQRFLPLGFPDRAAALEGGWERGWTIGAKTDRFSKGFLETMTLNTADLPSMFFNGTSVETGERIITSNCRIDGNFADATDVFDVLGGDVKLSTGVDNSTRFPYVSPAGTLVRDGKVQGHVVDGGYYENSGAVTAAELLRIVRTHPDYAAGRIRPYVIFINYRGLPAPVKPETRANEILSPIRTLLATRGAHGTVAVTQLAAAAGPGNHTSFTLVQHADEVQFPLGWLLALRTRDLIDKQMGENSEENRDNVRAIAAVLGAQAAADPVCALANAAEADKRQEEGQ